MRTLLVLALLVAAGGKDDEAELKKFEGTWQLVSEVMDGKEQPADYVGRIRWVLDDKGHWKIEDGGKVTFTGDMKVYPDRTPRAADSTLTSEGEHKGKVVRAIYKLDGDRLEQCWSRSRGRAAPRSDPEAGARHQLLGLQACEEMNPLGGPDPAESGSRLGVAVPNPGGWGRAERRPRRTPSAIAPGAPPPAHDPGHPGMSIATPRREPLWKSRAGRDARPTGATGRRDQEEPAPGRSKRARNGPAARGGGGASADGAGRPGWTPMRDGLWSRYRASRFRADSRFFSSS